LPVAEKGECRSHLHSLSIDDDVEAKRIRQQAGLGRRVVFVARLEPEFVVKGKEFESQFNAEKAVVEGYGGHLLLGFGEVRFSSLDLLQRELLETDFSSNRRQSTSPRVMPPTSCPLSTGRQRMSRAPATRCLLALP
jgi:hypothetical protein